MDQELQTILKDRYSMLTPEVKRAISAVDLPTRMETIANKNALHIDQSGGLLTEVYLVMLGMEKSENFAQNISKNLGITYNLAVAIAGDVNREIFLPIRASLEEMSAVQEEIERQASDRATGTERAEILDGIENPVPTKPTTSIAQIPERELVKRTTTNDFIAQKMSPNVTPSQNTSASPIQKKYVEDPYREPIK